MAKQSSSAFSVFLVDGVSLLAAKLQGVTHKVESITEPSHGLGDSSESHSPVGMMKATLTQDGAFFDSGAGGMHEQFRTPSSVIRQIVFSLGGSTFTGGLGAFTTSYEVIVSNGKLTKANAGYVVSGAVETNGIILQNAAQTVDWNGASVDNLASSAAGGVGYLQVTALAGITGFVGYIEDSVDNAAWTPLITFTNITAAPAAQRIAVAGTVKRYVRFRGDVTGTGSLSVFGGFARA